VHRYSRDVPLEEQLDRFSEALAPLAAAAHRLGCPLAIHKVGHYGADLAELCRRTPHLGIELDTGNAFLIGEPPVEAAKAAAPYTIGTHFKDHYVEPSFDPLGMRVRGAVPGEGDAELRAIYDVLMRSAPRPEELVMLMEIDPVEGLDQRTALERAVEFLRGLEPRLTWTI
jgi:sugar phosphate isomerase/epimerase